MVGNFKISMFLCLMLICIPVIKARAQDSAGSIGLQIRRHYLESVEGKLDKWKRQTDKYNRKMLNNLIKGEKKMQRRIAQTDSLTAKKLFAYSIDSLQKFKAYLTGRLVPVQRTTRSYFPYIDTLKQSLKFLNGIKEVTDQSGHLQGRLQSSLHAADEIDSRLGNMENLEHYIDARKQVLAPYVQQYPQLTRNLKKINKQAYYYSEQIKQYKQTLQDPSKIEEAVLRTVGRMPAFQQLIQRNSALSGIFASRASFSTLLQGDDIPIVNGLPSRVSLQAFVQSNIPSSGLAGAVKRMTQQLPDLVFKADQGLHQLQNKFNKAGGTGGRSLPGFKPNGQRTKSFRKRLEYGTDLQFGKSIRYLPATAAIAAKLGYKVNDNSTIGTGVSYMAGLGSGWKNIRFSTQSVGLCTYITWKLKKGLDIQGGSEWNYLLQLKDQMQLQHPATWQQSALLGLRRSYATGRKLKGNIQVLYDFLYNRHLPASQPLLFRFGYSL